MPLFSANSEFEEEPPARLQSVELLTLSEWMVKISTVPYNLIHNKDQQWFRALGKPKARLRMSGSQCVGVIETEWVAGPVSRIRQAALLFRSEYRSSELALWRSPMGRKQSDR